MSEIRRVSGCGCRGKGRIRPGQRAAQGRPVEARAWVGLASRSDVLMPGNVDDRVLLGNGGQQAQQGFVLRVFKTVAFQAFEFDADGVVIAIVAASVV